MSRRKNRNRPSDILRKSDTVVTLRVEEPQTKSAMPLGGGNDSGVQMGTTRRLGAALAGAFTGNQASNHWEESGHVDGVGGIAITAISDQMHAATVTVYEDGENQDRFAQKRKSMRARFETRGGVSSRQLKSIYGPDEAFQGELDRSHPLVRLMHTPNPYEPGSIFRYRQALQIRATGSTYVWNVPSQLGRTCMRFVIPTTSITPVWPSADMPFGGFRIQPNCMRWVTAFGDDQGYIAGNPVLSQVLGMVIDARQIQKVFYPHPIWLDDGMSPISMGAQWSDAERAINIARAKGAQQGADPSILVELPAEMKDLDQDSMDLIQRKYDKRYGGPENAGRALVVAPNTKATVLSGTQKDMAYKEGFEDIKNILLANHKTPPVVIGLQEAGAYAAYNASMKAWRNSMLVPLCSMLAESDTFHLAPQFGPGLTIEMEPLPINDKDEELRETQMLGALKVLKRDEIRVQYGFQPVGGAEGEEYVGSTSPNQNGQQQGQQKQPGAQTPNPDMKMPDGIPNEPSGPDAPKIDKPEESKPPSVSKVLKAVMDGFRDVDKAVRKAEHDVAGESRDADGKWTTGGSTRSKLEFTEADGSKFHPNWMNRKNGKQECIFNVGKHVDDEGVTRSTPYEAQLQKVGENYFELDESELEQKLASEVERRIGEEAREFTFENVRTGYGEEGNSYGVTGTGNAREVIQKASIALVHAINTQEPPIVYFTAAERSRSGLYDLLSRKAQTHTGYQAFKANLGDGNPDMFVLVNPKHAEEFQSICSDCNVPIKRLKESRDRTFAEPPSVKSMKIAGPHKFATTQVNFPSDFAESVKAFGRMIPDADICEEEGGRETDIHATVKYGIHDSDPDGVRSVIRQNFHKPIEVETGKTSIFECNGYDVLKIDLLSAGLTLLNQLISDNCECTTTHSLYSPHVTIAYLKQGCGQKYVGHNWFAGQSFAFDSIEFGSQSGAKTTIKLTGGKSNGHASNAKESLGMSVSTGSNGGFTVPEGKGYGRCPICGADSITRERRSDGNDTCRKGCSFPSKSVLPYGTNGKSHNRLKSFNPDQERDENGRWSSHGVALAHAGEFNKILAEHGQPLASVHEVAGKYAVTHPTAGAPHLEMPEGGHEIQDEDDGYLAELQSQHADLQQVNQILQKYGMSPEKLNENWESPIILEDLQDAGEETDRINEILKKNGLDPVGLMRGRDAYYPAGRLDLEGLQEQQDNLQKVNKILAKEGLPADKLDDDWESAEPSEVQAAVADTKKINKILLQHGLGSVDLTKTEDGNYQPNAHQSPDDLAEYSSQIKAANHKLEQAGVADRISLTATRDADGMMNYEPSHDPEEAADAADIAGGLNKKLAAAGLHPGVGVELGADGSVNVSHDPDEIESALDVLRDFKRKKAVSEMPKWAKETLSPFMKTWEESKHPRGQTENAGQFASAPSASKPSEAFAASAPESTTAIMDVDAPKIEKVDPRKLDPNPRQEDELDEDNVNGLVEKLKQGKELDPIVAIHERMEVVDGNHRLEAYRRVGKEAPVIFISKKEYQELKEDNSDGEFTDTLMAQMGNAQHDS